VGLSGRLLYLTTFRHSRLWATGLQPLEVSYRHKHWEMGGAFSLSSRLERYRSPSLPNQWGVGMSLSYSFGERPHKI
jgi:hypothetical protein